MSDEMKKVVDRDVAQGALLVAVQRYVKLVKQSDYDEKSIETLADLMAAMVVYIGVREEDALDKLDGLVEAKVVSLAYTLGITDDANAK